MLSLFMLITAELFIGISLCCTKIGSVSFLTNISRNFMKGDGENDTNFAAVLIRVHMKKTMLRRYALFLVSLFVNAFGIAFITKAMLGTSPITSVTYVLSMFTPFTIGQWTILLNLLFVVLELPLMTRAELRGDLRMYLLQIPISLCFGTFIDVSMNLLFWLNPVAYVMQLVVLLIGCVILALGIALEVKADAAMMAGEYFVQVISRHFRKEFGFMKLGFDVTLVCIACLLSLVFLETIEGVREGTVAAALLVGPIVHFVSPYYRFLDRWIGPSVSMPVAVGKETPHFVVTIAREYGSGGHVLGEMLAKRLGVRLYDKEFLHLAAQQSGIDETYIKAHEQQLPSYWLKCIQGRKSDSLLEKSLSPDDVLFVAESKIIRELVEKESCVIVGRCADFVLQGYPRVIRVFCYSDLESACSRCVSEYGLKADEAAGEIKRVNRSRRAHYEYYTGQKWGMAEHYDLMINTGVVPVEKVCDILVSLCSRFKEKTEKQ